MTKPLEQIEKIKRWINRHSARWSPVWRDTPCLTPGIAPNAYGYVMIFRDGRHQYLHKVIWEATFRPVPAGYELDHLCRNRGCVNPFHLDPVTHKENIRRGRIPSKLTYSQAEQIRSEYAGGGISMSSLSNKFSVTKETISQIVNRKTWHHQYLLEGERQWNSKAQQDVPG